MLVRFVAISIAIAFGLGSFQPLLARAAKLPTNRKPLNMSVAEKIGDTRGHFCTFPKAALITNHHASLGLHVRAGVYETQPSFECCNQSAAANYAPAASPANRIRAP